jgi:hypothetical protein
VSPPTTATAGERAAAIAWVGHACSIWSSRMAPRRSLAALLVVVGLAVPSAALAQSAGDNQYQDPFGGDSGGQQGSSGGDQGSSSGGSGTTTTAQAAPTVTPVPTAPAIAPPTQNAAPAAQQLPRTGGDPITPAVAGFWLLLGGVALRARVRPR